MKFNLESCLGYIDRDTYHKEASGNVPLEALQKQRNSLPNEELFYIARVINKSGDEAKFAADYYVKIDRFVQQKRRLLPLFISGFTTIEFTPVSVDDWSLLSNKPSSSPINNAGKLYERTPAQLHGVSYVYFVSHEIGYFIKENGGLDKELSALTKPLAVCVPC